MQRLTQQAGRRDTVQVREQQSFDLAHDRAAIARAQPQPAFRAQSLASASARYIQLANELHALPGDPVL